MQCLNKYFILYASTPSKKNMHNVHGELLINVKERCLHEFTSKCYTTFFGIKFL